MNPFEELLDTVGGVWMWILCFITFPLWIIPYLIYFSIKDR